VDRKHLSEPDYTETGRYRLVDKFVEISQYEFEKALKKFKPQRIRPTGVFEAVYKIFLQNGLSIWIYSTIRRDTGVSREKGSDAIRTVMMYRDNRIIQTAPKTLRTSNWDEILIRKIEDMIDMSTDYLDPNGHPLLKKKKKEGKGIFYGCALYPECKYIYKGEKPLSELYGEQT
jgi:hypothetical protein